MKCLLQPLAVTLTIFQLFGASMASQNMSPELMGSVNNPSRQLYAVFGANGALQNPVAVASPGQVLVKQQVTTPPMLGVRAVDLPRNASSASSRYALIMVDPDTNITDPTNSLLNYMVRDMTINNATLPASGVNVSALASGSVVAPWLAPDGMSASIPSNFTLMLFRQPSNLAVPDRFQSFMNLDATTRRNFPLIDFLNATGLGLTPFAATYFGQGGAGNSSIVVNSNSTGSASATGVSAGVATSTTAASSYYSYTYSMPSPTAVSPVSTTSASSSASAKPTTGSAPVSSADRGFILGALGLAACGLLVF